MNAEQGKTVNLWVTGGLDPRLVQALLGPLIATRLMEVYRRRIESRTRHNEDDLETARQMDQIERHLRLAGLSAERAEFTRLGRARLLDEETAKRLIR